MALENIRLVLGHILVLAVICLHIWFLIMEMFLWAQPLGLRIFRQSIEQAQRSAVLAANQGLYNGFLAAGLIWGMFHSNSQFSREIKFFFLSCVLIAGLYGWKTVSKRIFFIQALPALLGLLCIF